MPIPTVARRLLVLAAVTAVTPLAFAAPAAAADAGGAASGVDIEWVNPSASVGMFGDPLEFDLRVTGLVPATATGVQLKVDMAENAGLDVWEFANGAWTQVTDSGGETPPAEFMLPDAGTPDGDGNVTLRLALAGTAGLQANGPFFVAPVPDVTVHAAIVPVDRDGNSNGPALASAAHKVSIVPLDISADWPATVQIGEASVFRVTYVNKAPSTFFNPIAGSAGHSVANIKSPEAYFFSDGHGAPKLKLEWSSTATGPWHSIAVTIPGIDGSEYFLPELPLDAKSAASIWLKWTPLGPPSGGTLRAQVGWIRVADITSIGPSQAYKSTAAPAAPNLPVTGAGNIVAIVAVGLVLLAGGVMLRVSTARRR